MSNSRLCTYVDINHTHWSNRKYPISRITIHVAAGDLSFGGYTATLRERDCSWNYAVQSDGQIGLFVEECNRAWTTGSDTDPRGSLNDHRAVTMEVSNIEVEESDKQESSDKYEVTAAALDAVINLCEDICRRNGKTTLIWFGDLERSESYTPKSHEMVMTVHKWYANTSCPGKYLYEKQPYIAQIVTSRLGGPNTITYPDGSVISAYNSAVTGMVHFSPEELIDTSVLSPYIITTSRNTSSVNYTQLKKLGVTGVVLEAGQYYDIIHTENNSITYRNPKLNSQILEAVKSEIPYGYWYPVRARTAAEAYKEARALVSIVRLWSPSIGVWLKLELVKTKYVNDTILDTYREILTDAGLYNQIGIYCNKSQLRNISWDKHQDHFILWLDDHLSTTFDVDELLSPGFFNINSDGTDDGGFMSMTIANLYEGQELSGKEDAVIREVAYVDSRSEPSILSTDIKLSVINYTSALAAIFNTMVKPTFTLSSVTSDVILDNLDSVKREIIQFLIDKGFPASAGVGVLANIYHESSCRTNTLGDYRNGVPTSFGICQWHNERGTDMKKYVGSNWASNLTGQLNFLYHELSTEYSTLVALMKSAPNNADGAAYVADIFVRQFERPARVDSESVERQSTAREFWSKIVPQLT